MKSLVYFILIAAVKSGRVDYGEAEDSYEATNDTLADFYEKYGEDSLTGYEPFYEKLDEAILDEPYEEFDDTVNVTDVVDDSYYRGGFRGPYEIPYTRPLHECGKYSIVPTSTSYVTLTTTSLWLNTITHSSFNLIVSVDTVFVTATECSTTTYISTEPPLTVTYPLSISKIWANVTDHRTRVVDKTYTNCFPTTETHIIYARATKCATECATSTSTKVADQFITTYWTHTLTLHKKMIVSTVWAVTVTITDHFTDIKKETVKDFYTVSELVYKTEFDVVMIGSTSTLWVTHAVKTDCL